jgi:nucleotide-binding universal stress UspA family protein
MSDFEVRIAAARLLTAMDEEVRGANTFAGCQLWRERVAKQAQSLREALRLVPPSADQTPAEEPSHAQFGRVLVAVDESPAALAAVRWATLLSRTLGSKMALVHVVGNPLEFAPELALTHDPLVEQVREDGQHALAAAAALISDDINAIQVMREGAAATEILAVADLWHADLIVMGTRGRGRLANFLLGSTTELVIRRAACPVVCITAQAAKGYPEAEVEVGRCSRFS